MWVAPIDVIDIAESTVLGAAMFTLTGARRFCKRRRGTAKNEADLPTN